MHPDGHLEVKLKYTPETHEGREERIARRKKELRELVRDAKAEAGERSVYVNSLSQHSKEQIDNRIANGEDRDAIADEYVALYNRFLGNYSEKIPEEKIIGYLITLKGAEYYARDEQAKYLDAGGNNGNSDGSSNGGGSSGVDGRRGRSKQSVNNNQAKSRSKESGFFDAVKSLMQVKRQAS